MGKVNKCSTPSLKQNKGQAQWCTFVIPDTQEAETGGSTTWQN
jgi:hypothetical protein